MYTVSSFQVGCWLRGWMMLNDQLRQIATGFQLPKNGNHVRFWRFPLGAPDGRQAYAPSSWLTPEWLPYEPTRWPPINQPIHVVKVSHGYLTKPWIMGGANLWWPMVNHLCVEGAARRTRLPGGPHRTIEEGDRRRGPERHDFKRHGGPQSDELHGVGWVWSCPPLSVFKRFLKVF